MANPSNAGAAPAEKSSPITQADVDKMIEDKRAAMRPNEKARAPITQNSGAASDPLPLDTLRDLCLQYAASPQRVYGDPMFAATLLGKAALAIVILTCATREDLRDSMTYQHGPYAATVGPTDPFEEDSDGDQAASEEGPGEEGGAR